MAKRGRSKKQAITLNVGSDPELWRYDSLPEALAANVDVIVRLMRPEKMSSRKDEPPAKDEESSEPKDADK